MQRIARFVASSFLQRFISTRNVKLEERLDRKDLCLVPLLILVMHLKCRCVSVAVDFLWYGDGIEPCWTLVLALFSWWTTASQVKAYIERYLRRAILRQMAALATVGIILLLSRIIRTAFLGLNCSMLTSATEDYVNASQNCIHVWTATDFSDGPRVLARRGEPVEIPSTRPHVFECCSLPATIVAWVYVHALSMLTLAILGALSGKQYRRIGSLAKRISILDIWLVWQICEIVTKILVRLCMATQLRKLRASAERARVRAAILNEDTAASIFVFLPTSDLLQLLFIPPGKSSRSLYPQWHRALLRSIRQRSPLTLTVSQAFSWSLTGEVRDRSGQIVAKLANAGECQRSPVFRHVSALELQVSVTGDKRLVEWAALDLLLSMPKLCSLTLTAANDDSANMRLPGRSQLAFALIDSSELANKLAQLGRRLTSLRLQTEFGIAEPAIPRTLAIVPRFTNLHTLETSVQRFIRVAELSLNRGNLFQLVTLSLLEGADDRNAERQTPTHAMAAFIVHRCASLQRLSIPLAASSGKQALTVAEFFAMLRQLQQLSRVQLLIVNSTNLRIAPDELPVPTVRDLSIKTRTGQLLNHLVDIFTGVTSMELTTELQQLWPFFTALSGRLRCLTLADFRVRDEFISCNDLRGILETLDCPELCLSEALPPAFFETASQIAEICSLCSSTRMRSVTIAGAFPAIELAQLQRDKRFAFSWLVGEKKREKRCCRSPKANTIFVSHTARTNFKLRGRKPAGPDAGELFELRVRGNGCEMPREPLVDEGWFVDELI